MTRAARLAVPVVKEIRGVWVAWLASVVVMVAAAVGGRQWSGVVLPAYFLGAAALGALSIGHEYSHHTITLLLSQPARRERLLLVKLGGLAAMLLALCAVAAVVLFEGNGILRGFGSRRPERAAVSVVLWLPVVYALFVAPSLTMLCRSPIAGAVFTMALPGLLLIAGELLGTAKYGYRSGTDGFRMAVLWWGTRGVCAVGAVAGWRMFMRLEAIDGPGPVVGLPQGLRRRSATSTAAPAFTKRRAMWLLAKKELRLQQLALAVAGLYLFGWLTVVLLRHLGATEIGGAFSVLTILYSGLMAVLIGSLASAEERQLGTLEWQLLLPIATSKQWAAKAGMVLGLAMLLAIAFPLMLAVVHPIAHVGVRALFTTTVVLVIILLTAGSLYVSSLCASGLWALLMSLPALFGAALYVKELSDRCHPWVWGLALGVSRRIGRQRLVSGIHLMPFDGILALFVAGLLALILRFGLTNHRSTDRAAGRVWTQAIWIAGCVTLGVVLLTALDDLARLAAG